MDNRIPEFVCEDTTEKYNGSSLCDIRGADIVFVGLDGFEEERLFDVVDNCCGFVTDSDACHDRRDSHDHVSLEWRGSDTDDPHLKA